MPYTILNPDLDVCGILDLKGRGCKFYDDIRSTKIADDQGKIWSDTLEISVPYGYDETDYITQGYHLLAEDADGYTYCYRIYNWVDSAIGSTHVKKAMSANLIAWDLIHKITPVKTFSDANSQDVFEWILQGSGWEINQNEFFGDSRPVEFTAGQNAMYWLNEQINNFNVEIRAYVQIYNGRVVRKLVDIVEELGESNGDRLEYSHDLLGLSRTGDDSQLYTKLYVYGAPDKNGNPISIASVNGNKDFIVDDDANDQFNNGGLYLEGYITNDTMTSPGALLDWGKKALAKLNHPRYAYSVDVAYLGFTPNLGDHFQIVDFSMSPELTISARVIQLDESEANPINNKITVGEFIDIVAVTPSDILKLQAKAEKTASDLEKAIALKNTFYRQDTTPVDATEGDFWIYTGTVAGIPPVQQFKSGVWIEVKELQGVQGTPGQPGADGKSTYLHVAYADDISGNGFSQSPTGKTYMGTYVDEIQNDSTDKTKYTWFKFQGPQGTQGIQGLQGPKGDQGIQGATGADGRPSYTHIAYATNSTGTAGFSTSDPVGKSYIGMYVDSIATDSQNPASYKWTLMKGADGAQGAQGVPGQPGADGLTPYFHVAYATNSTGTAGFSTTDPVGKTYIGQYTDYVQNDSTDPTKYKWTLMKGADGKGISLITEYYLATSASSGVTTATAGWTTTIQNITGINKYLWNYTKITYTDASTANSLPIIKGVYGDTGSQGPKGDTGATGSQGPQGIQGLPGTPGQDKYTWVKYAIDQYGGNMSDSPSGMRYIGLAFNKTTATESTIAGDYQWSPLYDNVKAGSRNMLRGTLIPADTLPFTNVSNQTGIMYQFYPVGFVAGDVAIVSFDVDYTGINAAGAGTKAFFIQGQGDVTGWTDAFQGVNLTSKFDFVTGTGKFHYSYPITLSANQLTNNYLNFGWRADYLSAGTITISNARITKSNIEMDWSPAPEDIVSMVDDKAEGGDLDKLAEYVDLINSKVSNKAEADSLQKLTDDYNEMVAQGKIDAAAVSDSLTKLDERVTQNEIIVGDAKLVTDFINTVITQSEEGIYIANNNSSTGILISDNRISFMDNNVEVAYINNQTMQINHGIFVESAVIANYNFELIPGTKILTISWVGD